MVIRIRSRVMQKTVFVLLCLSLVIPCQAQAFIANPDGSDDCSTIQLSDPNETDLDVKPHTVGGRINTGAYEYNHIPIANAGPGKYTTGLTYLDASASYDPDGCGTLWYRWRQISGPPVAIGNPNAPRLQLTFTQTNAIQEFKFELVVGNDMAESLPDIVKVTVVPLCPYSDTMNLETGVFDPNKPTLVFFAGGDCSTGGIPNSGFLYSSPLWRNANIINFTHYGPPYERCGDILIAYLSGVAPDYKQLIQTAGFSTGNIPAMKVAVYLNRTYNDARYAVNHITLLDATCYYLGPEAEDFLSHPVEDEQCWIENYYREIGHAKYIPGALNVYMLPPPTDHYGVAFWYKSSIDPESSVWDSNDIFNNGITAGGYYSVAGPGKNLQISPVGDNYSFRCTGGFSQDDNYRGSGHLIEFGRTGRVPELPLLIGPADCEIVDSNGALLTCLESKNAAGYRLIFGPDPDHMVYLVSDTSHPPDEIITVFPFEQTFWTIEVYDRFGSTIYADPVCIRPQNVVPPASITNLDTGRNYPSLQAAINDAQDSERIAGSAAAYQYYSRLDFKDKNIILSSKKPGDTIPAVSGMVIRGRNQGPVVTFAGKQNAGCILEGFTITGGVGKNGGGIYCYQSSPTIRSCIITNNKAVNNGGGICCQNNSNANIINCIMTYNSAGILGGALCSDASLRPTVTNCTIVGNSAWFGSAFFISKQLIAKNCIFWDNLPSLDGIHGAGRLLYCDIQGGRAGEGNIDADPCFVNPDSSDFHLQSGSPCINTGDPAYVAGPNETDLDGRPRILLGRVDMGAYELNHIPVADAGPNQTAYAWIDGFAEVTLDGSASYDEDGDELTYIWKVDGKIITTNADGIINMLDYAAALKQSTAENLSLYLAAMAEAWLSTPASPNWNSNLDIASNDAIITIRLPVGVHTIELIVNDGIDDSEPNYTIVTVIEPLSCHLRVLPEVINRKSHQRHIMAWLTLPSEITRADVNDAVPLSLYPGGIEADGQYVFENWMGQDRHISILAFFDKAELMSAVPDNGRADLQVVGRLKSGRYLYGCDTVRIINPPCWHPHLP